MRPFGLLLLPALALTLFVAVAREVGLDAHFQEVRTPPVWDSRGDLYIYNLHINAIPIDIYL
jgi:hypothetical protein